ncbi:HAD-IIIC family phosphatase [Cohnella xylanilytica]|uniref:HAD-IIIC family phosphatase n=1 Tax=Cohnella xylanilytica TaxID=557555 RepID=A0A841U270_9BACL|nr:HAD-IIIC family phosphatase [Cohnella xylanilytica]MBB6692211.1 HAD-IIIC family phosphatase [Cohnella xylanilytica]
MLKKLEIERKLLGTELTRRNLLKIPHKSELPTVQIQVLRNFPFEYIGNILHPFFHIWGKEIEIKYSDYDASLSQINEVEECDLFILWIDWRLYLQKKRPDQVIGWIEERLISLRRKTNSNILINNWPEYIDPRDELYLGRNGQRTQLVSLNHYLNNLAEKIPGLYIIDLAYKIKGHQPVLDSRNDEISGYPFVDSFSISVAQFLGCQLIPSVLNYRIKALILDLDNTLYWGVLAEDGVDGVQLSKGHILLQELLLELKNKGLLLAICSKNEEEDVINFIQNHKSFKLKAKDFAVIKANWKSKNENIVDISRLLNIDISSMLFIDDNPSELLQAHNELPGLLLLLAGESGELTRDNIVNYPGILQVYEDVIASERTLDIQANIQREKIRNSANSQFDYLSSLGMQITFSINNEGHAKRLYELSQKTNQFNLAFKRFSEKEIWEIFNSDKYVVVTVGLSDNLTNSGIIGAIVCHYEKESAQLIEVIFSCRALGREVETISLFYLLQYLKTHGVHQLNIHKVKGPKNTPALNWFDRVIGHSTILDELLVKVEKLTKNIPCKVMVEEL